MLTSRARNKVKCVHVTRLRCLITVIGDQASQAGDVYAFAIIMQELAVRGCPFSNERKKKHFSSTNTNIGLCAFFNAVSPHKNQDFYPARLAGKYLLDMSIKFQRMSFSFK